MINGSNTHSSRPYFYNSNSRHIRYSGTSDSRDNVLGKKRKEMGSRKTGFDKFYRIFTERQSKDTGRPTESGTGNYSGSDRDVQQIERLRGELERVSNEYRQIRESILGYVKEAYSKKGGEISYIPCELNETITIVPGWTSTLIQQSPTADVFYCNVEKGSELSDHSHIQIEHITMVYGELQVVNIGTPPKIDIIKDHDSFHIDSQCRHAVKALKDTECIVVFKPSITTKI